MAAIVAESTRRGSAGASPSQKDTPIVSGETLNECPGGCGVPVSVHGVGVRLGH